MVSFACTFESPVITMLSIITALLSSDTDTLSVVVSAVFSFLGFSAPIIALTTHIIIISISMTAAAAAAIIG